MLFHTWTFAVFFLIFYLVYLGVKGTRFREVWLLFASYVFYGWWNPLYLALVVYSTTVDYFGVWAMAGSTRKKLWLCLTIGSNLTLLGLFKYGGFLTENLNWLLAGLGIAYAIPAPTWLLPVGLSFYTFQSMSYAIDFYRGRIPRETNLIRYAAFVSLFPQLVAGPIIRAGDLLPQLRTPRAISGHDISQGLSLFVVGLFKKVALADYLALYVDRVYNAPGQFQAPALILATVAFGWQIYFDFSGYTDMARGVARIVGFQFMWNFNHPYLASGLGDFWSRWHISLSTWFRDYVYISLGGNREGALATYRNMCLTMLLSGLWHGAAWTFVIWGGLHAAGRVLTRRLEREPFYVEKVPRIAKQQMVYAFVTFTWIFFRSHSLGDAWLIVTRILSSPWADPRVPALAMGLVLMVWVYQFMQESRFKAVLQLAPVRVALMVLMVLYLATIPNAEAQPFIYFQF